MATRHLEVHDFLSAFALDLTPFVDLTAEPNARQRRARKATRTSAGHQAVGFQQQASAADQVERIACEILGRVAGLPPTLFSRRFRGKIRRIALHTVATPIRRARSARFLRWLTGGFRNLELQC